MVKKFPYGYDVNAYIDKAFEQLKADCEGFIKKLYEGHEWQLEHANPVKEYIDVPATNTYSCDWYLEIYRIRKHELGGYSAYVQAGNRSK